LALFALIITNTAKNISQNLKIVLAIIVISEAETT